MSMPNFSDILFEARKLGIDQGTRYSFCLKIFSCFYNMAKWVLIPRCAYSIQVFRTSVH